VNTSGGWSADFNCQGKLSEMMGVQTLAGQKHDYRGLLVQRSWWTSNVCAAAVPESGTIPLQAKTLLPFLAHTIGLEVHPAKTSYEKRLNGKSSF
jgi:hypothetical protein